MSTRTKDALATAELVLAEDTRVTIKLLNHLNVKKKMLSCHEFNEQQRAALLEEISARDGTVSLVSDAGTPLVSDPGYEIVQKAIQLNMNVIPIPGPSAFLLALTGAGLPCDRFVFEGFLPDKAGERKKRLESLQSEERTMAFYIAPHDLSSRVGEMIEAFGDRKACLARELTKLHEEFIRSTLCGLQQYLVQHSVRGECVLIVGGASRQDKPDRDYVWRALCALLDKGEHLKDAAALIAADTGWSKSALYKLGIEYLNSSQ